MLLLAIRWFTDAVIMVLSARTFAAISDVVRHDQVISPVLQA